MKNISFTKMSGAGNDFILINKTQFPNIALTNSVISQLCNRRNGIGADGIIIIKKYQGYDFAMDYYNADGSSGTLCGNGARCAIKFANDTGISNADSVSFLSNEDKFSGELLANGLIKFNLQPPKVIDENITIDVDGSNVSASYVDTGSPHVVLIVDDLNLQPVIQVGKKIRNNHAFTPGGTNVNFIKFVNGKIHIRTYERGVENETLACGTGAVAAAIIGFRRFEIQPPIFLKTKGGDELIVNFNTDGSKYSNVSLIGPAKKIYNGEIGINFF
jgi:diaminopimelate epimerase